jgi:hypothetical protein
VLATLLPIFNVDKTMNKSIFALTITMLLSGCNSDTATNNSDNPTVSNSDQTATVEKVADVTEQKSTEITLASETANAKKATAEFAGNLKSKLMAAMKEGGPIKALGVCNSDAPKITAHLSDVYGKQLSRVSLKNRNKNNAPNEWQTKVLEDFAARKSQGADITKLSYAEIVTDKGKKQFRFMKAIPTQDACVMCHGENIPPALQKQITRLYPNDKATGFEKGDIRGAFVVVNNLD